MVWSVGNYGDPCQCNCKAPLECQCYMIRSCKVKHTCHSCMAYRDDSMMLSSTCHMWLVLITSGCNLQLQASLVILSLGGSGWCSCRACTLVGTGQSVVCSSSMHDL